MPKTIKTIAIPAFGNGTTRYKLARLLPAGHRARIHLAHALHHRRRPQPGRRRLDRHACQLRAYPTIFDPATGRATASKWSSPCSSRSPTARPARCSSRGRRLEFRERYEISTDPQTYFDESGTAMERVASRMPRGR